MNIIFDSILNILGWIFENGELVIVPGQAIISEKIFDIHLRSVERFKEPLALS